MADCKTDFLWTPRDVFSYIIWRGHFWHPIWIFAKFWISQALWRFSSKSPISLKSPVSKGPLLASSSNRQRLAIFRHFCHFWTWMETYMEYFDKYAVLRSHWKCVVFHYFSWNGSGLICGVLIWGCSEITVFSLLTLFNHEILGHDALLFLDPIFVGLGNSPSLKRNCCEISVFPKTWKKHYMEITHFWPADPILWCMGKTPALERVAVKWVFPTIFHWISG